MRILNLGFYKTLKKKHLTNLTYYDIRKDALCNKLFYSLKFPKEGNKTNVYYGGKKP